MAHIGCLQPPPYNSHVQDLYQGYDVITTTILRDSSYRMGAVANL